jgi:hypothetical protein
VWEGEYGTNTVHMYVNGKMIPVETAPGMGVGKENDGGGKFKYDIFDTCKKLCNCHNVPAPSTTLEISLYSYLYLQLAQQH